ncbi:MAG: hypothetical protein ABI556_09675 [Gemmatimonadales bacterium]
MDPEVGNFAVVMIVIAGFATAMTALVLTVKIIVQKTKPKPVASEWSVPRIDEDRFARLENAVDAIAVEVERMSEAQRFSAKLMSERLPSPSGDSR